MSNKSKQPVNDKKKPATAATAESDDEMSVEAPVKKVAPPPKTATPSKTGSSKQQAIVKTVSLDGDEEEEAPEQQPEEEEAEPEPTPAPAANPRKRKVRPQQTSLDKFPKKALPEPEEEEEEPAPAEEEVEPEPEPAPKRRKIVEPPPPTVAKANGKPTPKPKQPEPPQEENDELKIEEEKDKGPKLTEMFGTVPRILTKTKTGVFDYIDAAPNDLQVQLNTIIDDLYASAELKAYLEFIIRNATTAHLKPHEIVPIASINGTPPHDKLFSVIASSFKELKKKASSRASKKNTDANAPVPMPPHIICKKLAHEFSSLTQMYQTNKEMENFKDAEKIIVSLVTDYLRTHDGVFVYNSPDGRKLIASDNVVKQSLSKQLKETIRHLGREPSPVSSRLRNNWQSWELGDVLLASVIAGTQAKVDEQDRMFDNTEEELPDLNVADLKSLLAWLKRGGSDFSSRLYEEENSRLLFKHILGGLVEKTKPKRDGSKKNQKTMNKSSDSVPAPSPATTTTSTTPRAKPKPKEPEPEVDSDDAQPDVAEMGDGYEPEEKPVVAKAPTKKAAFVKPIPQLHIADEEEEGEADDEMEVEAPVKPKKAPAVAPKKAAAPPAEAEEDNEETAVATGEAEPADDNLELNGSADDE